MKIFKAAVLFKTNGSLQVIEVITPNLQPGQVLIRNLFSGVCRSQLMEINGKRGEDIWLPHLLGHEAVGIIEEITETVTKVRVGDKVILSWIKGIGKHAANPSFKTKNGLVINSGATTTFSEYTVTSECFVTLAPLGFKDEVLPLFGCAFLTGAGMAVRSIEEHHKKIAIIGFGGVGSAAAIAVSNITNLELLIIEESSARRDLANKLGFNNVTDVFGSSRHIGTIDLCLESGGTVRSIELGFNLLSKFGKMVFASHPPASERITLNPHELLSGKKIEGSWGGGSVLDTDVELVSKIMSKKTHDLDILTGKIFNLANINSALSYINSGLPGRSVIAL